MRPQSGRVRFYVLGLVTVAAVVVAGVAVGVMRR